MQTNISPMTWMTSLLHRSRKKLFLKNTVSMNIALFHSNNVKQNRLETQNVKKRTANVQFLQLRSCHLELSKL